MQISGFIDIHSHILPKLDEGSSSVEETEEMLRIAKEDGISAMVATPHVLAGVYPNTRETIEEAIRDLSPVISGVTLYIGAEVRISRNLAKRISDNELPLINNNTFLLLELPAYVLPPIEELERFVKDLRTCKINPIFAHPERNMTIVNNLSIMERLIGCGAAFQLTSMSLTNCFGKQVKKAAMKMIQKGYVQVVASDAHNAGKRPPILSQGYAIVEKNFGIYEAERLFKQNPFKVISGEDLT